MERLTTKWNGTNELKGKVNIDCASICEDTFGCEVCPIQKAFDKLAEYEDLEEQGRLIKLPYKAGERVWILYSDKQIEENYVASIQIGEKYDRLCFADGYVYTIWDKDYEEAKKWVYTSKEEAEKALEEMGK